MICRPLHTRRAFTLIELVLVLTIVAALGILVLPAISGTTARGRVEHQARAVLALARKARALSAAEGRAYLLIIDPAGRELRLARRRDPLAKPQDDENPELDVPTEPKGWAQPIPFPEDVTLESVLLNGEAVELGDETLTISFFPTGEAEAVQLVFVGAGEERRTVTIDPHLGLARIVPSEEEEA